MLRASAPADVMCWQCVWSSPVAGWPAGFLNIRARLGAEPVLSRAGSPDGAQPALAAPSHVLRASAPADVMCWQCVWSSPVAGWPAGFLNIRARLGAEPVLSRAGSPDGAQPALAAPYAGAAVAPPAAAGRRLKTREVPVCRRLPRRAARAGRLLPTLFLAAGGNGRGR